MKLPLTSQGDSDADWVAAIRAALPAPEGGFPSQAGFSAVKNGSSRL